MSSLERPIAGALCRSARFFTVKNECFALIQKVLGQAHLCLYSVQFCDLQVYEIASDLQMTLVKTIPIGSEVLGLQVVQTRRFGSIAVVATLQQVMAFALATYERVLDRRFEQETFAGLGSHLSCCDGTICVGGLRDTVLLFEFDDEIRPRCRQSLGRVIQFLHLDDDGALTIVYLVDASPVCHVDLWQVQESGLSLVSQARLPKEFAFISAASRVSGSIFVLFSGAIGVLVNVDGAHVKVGSPFRIQLGASTSAQVVCVGNPMALGNAVRFFVASDEQLFLISYSGDTVRVDPVDAPVSRPNSLCATGHPDLLLVTSAFSDTVLFKVDYRHGKLAELVECHRLACWGPIASLKVAEKSTFALCGTEKSAGIYRLCHGVPVCVLGQTDVAFKGCTGLWPLRRHRSDRHHSFLVASFVRCTFVFRIVGTGEFEDISEVSGLETSAPTIAVANSDTGCFVIQVCSDRVVVSRIPSSDCLETSVPSVWTSDSRRPEILSAIIIKNVVFLYDGLGEELLMLKVKIHVGRGTSEIEKVGAFRPNSPYSCFAVYSPEPEHDKASRRNFVLGTLGAQGTLNIFHILIDANTCKVDAAGPVSLAGTAPVNSLRFWPSPHGGIRLGVGFRNGTLQVYRVSDYHLLFEAKTNSAPVTFATLKHPSGPLPLVVSYGVFFLLQGPSGKSFQLVPMASRVQWVCDLRLDSLAGSYSFAFVKNDTLAFASSSLIPSSWMNLAISCPDAVNFDFPKSLKTAAIITCPKEFTMDSSSTILVFGFQEKELLFRTKFSWDTKAVCLCTLQVWLAHLAGCLDREGFVAVGLNTPERHGQLVVYSFPPDRIARRRPPLSSPPRLNAPSLTLVCDFGFASEITGVAELEDGRLFVTCDSEFHIMNLDYQESSLTILRTEPRRYEIAHIALRSGLVAIVDKRDGVEILQYDSQQCQMRHVKGDSRPRLGTQIAWIDDRTIGGIDRRGLVFVVQNLEQNMWLHEMTSRYLDGDIPLCLCRSPDDPSGASGAFGASSAFGASGASSAFGASGASDASDDQLPGDNDCILVGTATGSLFRLNIPQK